MKKSFIFVILFIVSNVLFSQNVITFGNNQFIINGSPFFPIGWYDCATTQELVEVNNNGANTVLVLHHFFMERNSRPNERKPDPVDNYRNKLVPYLQSADSLGLKIIIQLPNKVGSTVITDTSYIIKIVGDSVIRNHSALLGWYIADEPELSNDSSQPYHRLQYWYSLIKQLDNDHHPVFVACNNGYLLENQTIFDTTNVFSDSLKFFDVLMQDMYCIYEDDEAPSPKLELFDEYLLSLYHCFDDYHDHGLSASSTMLIVQGFSGFGTGLRVMHHCEIKYQVFSSLFYAQDDKFVGHVNQNTINAGGIMFWRYFAANDSFKDSIKAFIEYFKDNSLAPAVHSENVNSLVSDDNNHIFTFTRKIADTLYLFAINRSDSEQNVNFTINIQSYSDFWELGILDSTQSNLVPNGNTNNFNFNTHFDKREAKAYKIRDVVVTIPPDKPLSSKTSEIIEFSLSQNFPNPFNPVTTIYYSIPYSSHVQIRVYDILGREIKNIVDEVKQTGNYSVDFDASELPSGIYHYSVRADNFWEAKKMILLK